MSRMGMVEVQNADRQPSDTSDLSGLTIEDLLSGTFSRRTFRRFGRSWLRIELAEGQAGIDQVRRDLVRTEKWKDAVLQSLKAGEQDQAMLADRWVGVIKLRIEALDAWAQLVGALTAYTAGGCAVLALAAQDLPAIKNSMIGLGICISAFGGLYRYYIDRHKASQKFVLTCLEAARKR